MTVPMLILKLAITAFAILIVSLFAPIESANEAAHAKTAEKDGPCGTCLSVVIF